MTAPNKMAKRAAAGTLALAVCFAGGVLGAGAAQADENFNFDTRFGGATRIDTAVQASAAAFNDGSNTVVVVNENRFADGLTASYAAGIADDNAGAPILYVSQNSVPSQTSDEIKRLGAKNVIIVGGTAVVSDGVQASLDSFVDNVTRLSGRDRFETAARVATSGSNDVGTVFIANGDATADALAAGPIAYRSHNPIVLVQRDSVPGSAKAALDRLNEENRIVVGGKAVVSDDGYTAANATARLSGSTRQGTAVELAKYAIANEDGFDSGNIALVGSQDRNAADALVAAPVAGKAGTPILFTEGTSLGSMTTEYLQSIAGDLDGTGYVFGGRAAVPDNVAGEGKAAAGGTGTTTPPPPSNGQGIAVTPTDAVVNDVSVGTGTDKNRGSRTYTATRLDNDKKYVVGLLDAENVIVAADGSVTFRDTDQNNRIALVTGGAARIEVTNGAATNAESVTDVSPIDGKITFNVDSEGYANVVPVVFEDSTNNGELDLVKPTTKNADPKAADEYSGVGGAILYVPGEAATGTYDVTVLYVDKQQGYFIGQDTSDADNASDGTDTDGDDTDNAGTTQRYNFDAGDVYEYESSDGNTQTVRTINATQFAQALSVGDTVTGAAATEYSQDFRSGFQITADIPGTPTVTSAAVGNYDTSTSTTEANDVRLSWAAPSPADGLIVGYAVEVYKANQNDTPTTPAGAPVTGITYSGGANTASGGQIVAEDLPNGNYVWRVVAVSQSADAGKPSKTGSFTVQVGDVDEVVPTIVDTTLTNGDSMGNVATNIDGNDVITLDFSESMDPAALTDKFIRFTDPDGEVYQLKAVASGASAGEANLSFADYTPTGGTAITNGRLTLTLGGAPTKVGGPVVAAENDGAQVPATITAVSQDALQDTSGNDVDLANSADKVIDNELG